MKALWQIILAILWRLRPVQALEVNLRDVIEIGLSLFADDLEVETLSADPHYRREIAAALADAHAKLGLLVYLRACELTNTRHAIRSFIPNHSFTHASTSLDALWRSFHRLIAKFDDYECLAAKRAERMKRDATTLTPSLRDSPLRLDATHQSTSPACGGGGLATHTGLEVLPRQKRGRWIGASSRRDGGGCASSRGWLHATGPPYSARLPIADCRLPQKPSFRDRPRMPDPQPIRPANLRVHTEQIGETDRAASDRVYCSHGFMRMRHRAAITG